MVLSMTITLTPDLEKVVLQKARDQGITPEAIVLNAIREKLGLGPPVGQASSSRATSGKGGS